MLGSAMVPSLATAGHGVYPTDLRGRASGVDDARMGADGAPDRESMGHLDVRSRAQIDRWFDIVRPEFVVHLAAETDVELCETRPEHACATNALGTKLVALACRDAGVPLAYVSTAGVFDGKKVEPYTEDDPPRPINVYGRSKLEGERYVRAFIDCSYIVRAGWMVGGGDRDHKFVAKILWQLQRGARTLYAVGDKWGTPTYAPDFARCFTRLIETKSYGLYHMASLGKATRHDVARKILQVLGRDCDVELVEVDSEFFRESYPAPRPRSEMMQNLRLELRGLNSMRLWDDSIEEYLQTAFADLVAAPPPHPSPTRGAGRCPEPRRSPGAAGEPTW